MNLNTMTVEDAGELLALRATLARRGLRFTKEAQDPPQPGFFNSLAAGDSPGMEALRNALIGAGIGGIGGAASSLFAPKRRREPWRRALLGALLGAGLGGGGTAAYRAIEEKQEDDKRTRKERGEAAGEPRPPGQIAAFNEKLKLDQAAAQAAVKPEDQPGMSDEELAAMGLRERFGTDLGEEFGNASFGIGEMLRNPYTSPQLYGLLAGPTASVLGQYGLGGRPLPVLRSLPAYQRYWLEKNLELPEIKAIKAEEAIPAKGGKPAVPAVPDRPGRPGIPANPAVAQAVPNLTRANVRQLGHGGLSDSMKSVMQSPAYKKTLLGRGARGALVTALPYLLGWGVQEATGWGDPLQPNIGSIYTSGRRSIFGGSDK